MNPCYNRQDKTDSKGFSMFKKTIALEDSRCLPVLAGSARICLTGLFLLEVQYGNDRL